MTKIVYNASYGGFGLSHAGVMRYAEVKGITLYPESDERFSGALPPTYWLVPKDQRTGILDEDNFIMAPIEQRQASNKRYSELVFTPRDLNRADPVLAQVVEELGDAASGKHASLAIAEVPAGVKYRIDEYDGSESVMTVDDYEWSVA